MEKYDEKKNKNKNMKYRQKFINNVNLKQKY